jgi:hypothetical protein
VAGKVPLRIALLHDDARQESNHFVALPVLELIVVGFEVIEVAVARTEGVVSGEQAANMFAYWNIAW